MTEKLQEAAGRLFSLGAAAVAFGVPLITLIVYFAQIGPALNEQSRKIDELKITQLEQKVRVDRIEENRVIGLQRLAAVEELGKRMMAGMDQMSAKLDRILFERRR